MRVWCMRTGLSFTVSPTERQRMVALVRDRDAQQKYVWRERIIRLSACGVGNAEMMRQTGKIKTRGWRAQDRFAMESFEGSRVTRRPPSRNAPLR